MNAFSLTTTEQQHLAQLHQHLMAGGSLSSPFAREVFLMQTYVAGTAYVPLRDIETSLQTGDSLVLRRESGNPHDALAILILTAKGQKLGYVPRDRNEILARLMDAGKFLVARLESKEWEGDWLRLEARIFLKEI